MKLAATLLVLLTCAACSDDNSGPGTPLGVGPTNFSAMNVSVNQSGAAVGSCPTNSSFTPTISVIVVTTTNMNLDSGTIRLIDGSAVGGPTIPIPQSSLVNQSGTTIVQPAAPTVVNLQPVLPCPATFPTTAFVTLNAVDLKGATHVASNSGAIFQK
jgi:hypothetical protein